MNGNMTTLAAMQSIALYLNHPKGLVAAVASLISYGLTVEEATDLIALYDGYVTLVEGGKL